jgi:hypothetical protein
MASVFDQILLKGVRSGQMPARTRVARDWFRNVAKDVSSGRVTPNKIMSETTSLVSYPSVGSMYHFQYDPKHKRTLPYYDRFPLIFMVGPAPAGFYGLNLHYLQPELRAKLMDNLYTLSTNRKYDESTRIALSYGLLSKASRFKYFKPTFKHYLDMHVQSRFIQIAPTEWDIALMLPTQRFSKASKDEVWADSRASI